MEKSKFELFQKHKIEGLQQIVGGYTNTSCDGDGGCDVSFARNENANTRYTTNWVFTNGDPNPVDQDVVKGKVVKCPQADPNDTAEWMEAPEGMAFNYVP